MVEYKRNSESREVGCHTNTCMKRGEIMNLRSLSLCKRQNSKSTRKFLQSKPNDSRLFNQNRFTHSSQSRVEISSIFYLELIETASDFFLLQYVLVSLGMRIGFRKQNCTSEEFWVNEIKLLLLNESKTERSV